MMATVVRYILGLFLAYRVSGTSHEARLIDGILTNYSNPYARPVHHASTAVNVSVSFHLMQILDVDDKKQIIIVSGWLHAYWKDENISWDPAAYGDVQRVLIPSRRIWMPNIGQVNSVDGTFDLSLGQKSRIKIASDGTAHWSPGGIFRAACRLKMRYFPFDEQSCTLNFESWEYEREQLALVVHSSTVITASDIQNDHWNIVNTTVEIDSANEKGSALHVQFNLKRKAQYYVLNVIVPCIIISTLVIMVFRIPPEAGEKVTLGITVIVAFSVFQLLIVDIMPQSSEDSAPMLVIYFTMFMMMATTSTAMGVLVLNIHHQDVVVKLPYWLRYLSVRILAPLLFATDLAEPLRLELSLCALLNSPIRKKRLCVDEYEMSSRATLNTLFSEYESKNQTPVANSIRAGQGSLRGPSMTSSKANGHFSYSDKCNNSGHGLSFLQKQRSFNEYELITLSGSSSQNELNMIGSDGSDSMLIHILNEVKRINVKREQIMRRKHLLKEWKIVAQLIDRLLTVVFVMINSVGTSVCLLLATRG